MFDVVIRDGVVIDGTGSERLRADVGVTADRIAAIGDLQAVSASREICAAGQIVAPGFIDVHNHSDGWMHREPLLESKVRQGFSTEILMADGLGYAPVDETTARDWMYYLRTLDGLRMTDYRGWNSLEDFMAPLDHGNCQNSGFHIPWANVRSLVAGWGKSPLDDFQLQAACSEIRRGMEAGAVGLSTGLDYIVECFSSTRELTEVCKAMADFRGLYVTHIRYKKGVIAGVREAVEIGRDAGVAVHISHLKAQTAEQVQPLLEYIDREARQQVDFSFDVYPYQRSCTMLSSLLPYEIWEAGPLAAVGRLKDPQIRERFRHSLACYRLPLDRMIIGWTASGGLQHLQGLTLAEFVESSNQPAADSILDLLIDAGLGVLLVFHNGDDNLVDPFLQHDLQMLGTDGILVDSGYPHPRQYGSVGRFLGELVRDRQLMSLEAAVRKLTGWPAERFGLTDRGTLEVGKAADIVVFDPQTMSGAADYQDPTRWTSGISTLLVNGREVLDTAGTVGNPGSNAGGLPGRVLRSCRSM